MQKATSLQVDTTGSRLDRYIAEHLAELSRAAVQRLIADGQILVDNQPRKASYRVQIGERISVRIPSPESAKLRAEKIPLDIIFENRDLLVINKPAGMVVHPAAGHASHTLVNAILAHCPNLSIGGEERPGIVHRLDRDTSGLIVVAKNDAALHGLQAQFKSRSVKKVYLALVEGQVKPPRGIIDAPIGRDPTHREKMKVLTRGKTRQAVTVYRTRASFDYLFDSPSTSSGSLRVRSRRYTLVEAEPQTGRTHQIRVHLAFLGFPVVGDTLYGSKPSRSSAGKNKNTLGLARQFLHAWKIAFVLPHSGKHVEFIAPLPEDLRAVLAKLRFDSSDL